MTFWQYRHWFGAGYFVLVLHMQIENSLIYLNSEFVEETLSCIWLRMMYMICIILNNNGFAYQTLETPTFIMCFHSEMKVLL